jgi:hypothetical protein
VPRYSDRPEDAWGVQATADAGECRPYILEVHGLGAALGDQRGLDVVVDVAIDVAEVVGILHAGRLKRSSEALAVPHCRASWHAQSVNNGACQAAGLSGAIPLTPSSHVASAGGSPGDCPVCRGESSSTNESTKELTDGQGLLAQDRQGLLALDGGGAGFLSSSLPPSQDSMPAGVFLIKPSTLWDAKNFYRSDDLYH